MIARDVALGLLRHLLTMAGGVIAGRGYLDAQSLDLAVGAAVTLVGVVWSVLDKRRATSATTAVVLAPNADPEPIAAAAVEARAKDRAEELAKEAATAAAEAVAKNLRF